MKKYGITLMLLLFIFSACKKEKDGGNCEYTDIIKKVTVTFIDGELDSKFTVSFQPIGNDTDEIYRVTSKKLKEIKKNFNNKELQHKKNTFKLIISERTKGSCIPFMIKEISIEK